jgi:hypothetical protein
MNTAKKRRNHYVEIDERWWVYNSYSEWREYFSWLSKGAIQRLFLEMEKDTYVISRQGVKNPRDRRKWYTIDYEAYEQIVVPMITNCDYGDDHKLRSSMITKSDHDSSEITSETTAENTSLSAPNGAQGQKKSKPDDPVFNLIALEVFGIDPKNVGSAGGRVAIISNWLLAKNDGGKRSLGALEAAQSVDDIRAFVKSYRQNYPRINLPRDIAKFSEAYLAWMRVHAGSKPKDPNIELAAQMGISEAEYHEMRKEQAEQENARKITPEIKAGMDAAFAKLMAEKRQREEREANDTQK